METVFFPSLTGRNSCSHPLAQPSLLHRVDGQLRQECRHDALGCLILGVARQTKRIIALPTFSKLSHFNARVKIMSDWTWKATYRLQLNGDRDPSGIESATRGVNCRRRKRSEHMLKRSGTASSIRSPSSIIKGGMTTSSLRSWLSSPGVCQTRCPWLLSTDRDSRPQLC